MDERGTDRDDRRRSNRRAFLTSGAATLGAAWFPAIGVGKRRPNRERGGRRERESEAGSGRGRGKRRGRDGDRGHRDPYERSLYLRERAGWSNAKWRAYLSKRGIEHGVRERTYAVPQGGSIVGQTGKSGDDSESGGGVTTAKFDRYELVMQVTYSRPRYVGYDVIDVEWTFTDQELDDFAQSPADNVAISYRPEHYAPTNARAEWVYYGGNCTDPDGVDSKTPGGAVCAWRDIGDRDDGSYFGVYVDPNWEGFDAWERRVYVDFVHTWSGYGLTGVSVGLGGISMSFARNTDRWDVEDSAAEARLIDGERFNG